MSLLRYSGLLLFVLVMPGCAYLHSLDSELTGKIDQWIADEEYGLALSTLTHVKPDHPEYAALQQRQQRIATLATRLENTAISSARRQAQKHEWHAGLQTYNQALQKLPRSEKLHAARAEFLQQRAVYLRELELRLLVNKGEWLNRNAPIHAEIKRAAPDEYRRIPGVRDYERDTNITLPALVNCSETAMDAAEVALARQCLALAEQLGGDAEQSLPLARVKSQLDEVDRSQIQAQNRTTRNLIAELRKDYSLETLQRASQHLGVLQRRSRQDQESVKLRNEFNRLVQQTLEQQIEAGRQLYSGGKIDEALQIWEALQTVAPDNEQLAAHIDRARRVLDKVQRLHQAGPTITPPGGNGN